jgi:hypothetical protein
MKSEMLQDGYDGNTTCIGSLRSVQIMVFSSRIGWRYDLFSQVGQFIGM